MNSYRQGLRSGVLFNPKLFILEKVNFGPHTKCWSNLVKSGQTCYNLFYLVRVITISESINRPFIHSFCIHSFIMLYIIFVLFESSSQVLVQQPTKRSAFFVLGDHFILGDILPRTQSTTARAIICLKEIVSNTRLDHF